MLKKYIFLIILFVAYAHMFYAIKDIEKDFTVSIESEDFLKQADVCEEAIHPQEQETSERHVIKKRLENGLTILVHELHHIPKVSFQIWYNVGSKDELLGEKGIAHLIEHMIFKGTEILSESDINTVVHKLSGSCNAFTSYDYTGYLFNFPTHHWQEALPIVADCMINCSFKDDMLSSEMKAVVQELKLYRDQYDRSLMEEMISMIFADHPYHYPIIGYKQDLWSVKSADLLAFYKKHYMPNNATIVVVGDVKADEVFQLAEQYFGGIPHDPHYRKKDHFFHQDIASKSLTIYRDVAKPTLAYMFVVPGSREQKDASLDIFEWIIGKGKSSRLYKKLVNEERIATDVSTLFWNLFDHGVFFILVDPKDDKEFNNIEEKIIEELEYIAHHGVNHEELERGYKKTQMAFYSLLEAIEDQAYAIGHSFLATGDENYIFKSLNHSLPFFKKQIHEIIASCFRPAVMHKGYVLPLPTSEKKLWSLLQKESDEEDSRILDAHIRTTEVEEPSYAKTVEIKQANNFEFPHSQHYVLPNGMKVFFYYNKMTPKINIVIEFKARSSYYDPEDKQGLYNFVTDMMTEGTKNYTSSELADAIGSRGMAIDVYSGGISMKMVRDDFEYGLDILKEILMNATFPEEEIEKVRSQIISDIKQYWDEPRSFVSQLVRNVIYKGHPYCKQALGTIESINSITRDDLIDFYKKYISPAGARMAVVGDIDWDDVKSTLEKKLHNWKAVNGDIKEIEFPSLSCVESQDINYPMNRDQVVLCLAQLSVDRNHPNYDKLLLFDQIFGGGVLGSMSSRLFDLRERTGLFYTVRGSLIAGSDEQPGMFQIRTIVSVDRLAEAEKAIKNTIDTVIETLTEEDLEEAKRAVIGSLVDNFASNSAIAASFLFLERFNLPENYFDTRAERINAITLDEMKEAIKDMLHSDKLLTVRVGRV